jgi:NitT/TauT family transport system substrate-binding protein
MRLLSATLCLTLGLLLLPPPSSGAAERVRLAVGSPGFTLVPLYLAQALGTFEAHGLETERVTTQGSGLEVKALEAGQADFAFTPGDVYLAVPPGRPLLAVHGGLQRPIFNWVMQSGAARQRGLSDKSPLAQRLRALRGLTVGVPLAGGFGEQLARYVVMREGLRVGDEVKLLPVGGGNGWVTSLRQGRVEAALHLIPFPELAIARGEAISLLSHTRGEDEDLGELLMGVLLVRRETAERQGEKVRQMTRALVQATRWALGSPPARVAGVLQPFFPRGDAAEILEGVRAILPALNPHGRISERAFRKTGEVLESSGALKRRLRFEEAVSNDFLPG